MTTISQPVLELTLPAPTAASARWHPGGKAAGVLALVGGGALAATALSSSGATLNDMINRAMAAHDSSPADFAPIRIDLAEVAAVSAMTVDDRSQIIAEGESAQQRNAAILPSSAPLDVAKGFVLASLAKAEMPTAVRCLTQAVYYEAGFEPLSGRRAVAQVVLNRMRHPAYPKSVCGVVYQGAERHTGCQFSFTCDGALLRAPAAGAWREAEAVARAALGGFVERSVGTATHYHADYVLPKWAFNLAKIDQIGRHIFYRFQGGMGRATAFGGRYAANEQIPVLDVTALRERLAQAGPDGLTGETTPGLTVAPHVTDRHAANDVGGRIDVTKPWRLQIPDPVAANSRYRSLTGEASAPTAQVAAADVSSARVMEASQP